MTRSCASIASWPATAGRFPAVDPLASRTSIELSDDHRDAIGAARAVLSDSENPAGEALRDDLRQLLRVGEPFRGRPVELTPFAETDPVRRDVVMHQAADGSGLRDRTTLQPVQMSTGVARWSR